MMKIENLLGAASSDWARYSSYELRQDEYGVSFVTPAPDSVLELYNPINVSVEMMVDALNIGNSLVSKTPNQKQIEQSVLRFAKNYGLLGFMEYLPLNRNYFQREDAYLVKTDIVNAEKMPTKEYMALFLPFKKNPVKLNGILPLRPAEMTGRPLSFDVVSSNAYSERLEWLTSYFSGLFTHFAATFYYSRTSDPTFKDQCEDEIERFGNDGLAYTIRLQEGKPSIVWDFSSLKLALETIYSFYVTADNCPIRICKSCGKVFYAASARSEFCQAKCRNRHNVAAFRHRNKESC